MPASWYIVGFKKELACDIITPNFFLLDEKMWIYILIIAVMSFPIIIIIIIHKNITMLVDYLIGASIMMI